MPLGRARGFLAGRGLLLLPVAALAVHQLRYLLGYGSSAGQALAAQGHGYVNSLAPWLALLLAFAIGSGILRISAGLHGVATPTRRAFTAVWAASTVALIGLYVVQETLEEYVASGHPSGFTGVFGHGGWWALVLALAFGAVIAASVGLVDDLVEFAVRSRASRVWWAISVRHAFVEGTRVLAGVAFGWQGRGPPAQSIFAA
ncbi:MAG: hypothetical protein F2663_01085 [Actinobacteria bacterium]|uniref:Unannotated protein n=1 Tax=freshwater metagenome TaxID=449393 RepID=A0A6J6NFF9_9ZZZZ|nr:hypothetical protein [Actinomycetota bacterium]